MHYFLDPTFNPEKGILSEGESRHALKSLRLTSGNSLIVGNGRGNKYSCIVQSVDKNQLNLVVQSTEIFEPAEQKLSIALPPTKKPSRFEWFLEKATELGVDEIIPMQTARTERPRIKHERLEKILHAATKQSLRAYIPVLHPLRSFDEALSVPAGKRLMAHCEEGPKESLSEAVQTKNRSILILIGPEGDFTSDEITLAHENGFQVIDLGPNRLRTETAGVYCVAALSRRK
jgi:16S rRNA (uracil1498-N3)-methyltransferase